MKVRDTFGREWNGPYPFSIQGLKQARQDLAPDLKGYEYPNEDIPKFAWISREYAGVYKVTLSKQPVYIGVSKDSVFRRLREHISGRGNKHLKKVANLSGYEFFVWFCDGLSARQIESYILNSTDPPIFNEKNEIEHEIQSITMH